MGSPSIRAQLSCARILEKLDRQDDTPAVDLQILEEVR